MPDLIAQGTEAQHRWRRTLPDGEPVVLGRLVGGWGVPWDQQVSRRHASLLWTGKRLEVARLPDARNPLFLRGAPADRFSLGPGEHFVIGQTTFTLADQQVSVAADAPAPVQQQSFSAQYLKQVQFRNPDHRIEVLSRLPDVISGAAGDEELFVRLVSMLLAGVPRADAAAVVAVETEAARGLGTGTAATRWSMPSEMAERSEVRGQRSEVRGRKSDSENLQSPNLQISKSPNPKSHVLHWDQRLAVAADFRPSQGLILESLRQGQSVLHVWRGAAAAAPESYTVSDAFDWAFCTPVLGKPCRGWGLYVAGRFNAERSGLTPASDPSDLREDVKFTELVAAMLSSLREMRLLEHRHATLEPVLLAGGAGDAGRRRPGGRACAAGDGSLGHVLRSAGLFAGVGAAGRRPARALERVSKALGVMTRHIRQQGGVVGDFQGDAAMGFWGWPLPQPDAVARTCRRRPGRPRRVRGHHRPAGGHRRGHRPGRGRQDRHRRSGESDGFRAGRESGLPAGRDDQGDPGPDPAGRGDRPDRSPGGAAGGGPRPPAGGCPALRAGHAAGGERVAAAGSRNVPN